MQSFFGTGFMFVSPGQAAVGQTPQRVARLQDVSVDWNFEEKQLWGSNEFGVETARGKGSIKVKSTTGVIDPRLWNRTVFGNFGSANQQTLASVDEQGTVSGGNTIAVANSGGNYGTDLGVYSFALGIWLTRVASAPAAGQYSVNGTGTYTFNAAQTATVMQISYTYADTTTNSLATSFVNQTMGTGTVYAMDLFGSYKGGDQVTRRWYLHFYAVQCPKLSLPLKMDDFTLPVLEHTIQDDGMGNIFQMTATG